MDHYVEFRLLPDPEFPQAVLMEALFAKLHRALVQWGQGDIGVSFPAAGRDHLGDRLRLHGSEGTLSAFMAHAWLQGMADHLDALPLQPIPAHHQHCLVRRVQAQSSPERQRRRLIRRLGQRLGISPAEAAAQIGHCPAVRLDLPSLSVRSVSTGQRFRLFVDQQGLRDQPLSGGFNAYGLSQGATVPWF